ncbi:MAG: hypothetical protein NTZ64_15460 [Polaromonas sp.]|nr:hypothetical protein [Polaromonas sp.]
MSEYQYYEFSAVDQPLSAQQQAELRARSTRATITPGSFVNEYHWGDLKGDPLDWMQRYFDAHVYFANWGSARFMLRLPLAALDEAVLADFLQPSVAAADTGYGDIFTVTATATHWILDLSLCDDSGDYAHDWQEDEDSASAGWMARLLPLRDELLRGDTRPLYLGWLARVGSEEIGDEDLEPPLPAGLKNLTPAQMALVEFLEIPPDWLTAAAANSADLAGSTDTAPAIDAWLALQSPAQMRETLRLLLQQRGQEAERSLLGRFLAWQRVQQMPGTAAPSERRTVAQIEVGCTAAERIRLEREKRERDALAARKRAERDQHLLQVAARANAIWEIIDQTLQRGTGGAYEQAEKAVQELSEALALTGRQAEFRTGLARLMQTHDKRPAWVTRMRKAGLL